MTKDIACCSRMTTSKSQSRPWEKEQIRRLPVTDSHKTMIGMLSLGDILHKVSKDFGRHVAGRLGASRLVGQPRLGELQPTTFFGERSFLLFLFQLLESTSARQ